MPASGSVGVLNGSIAEPSIYFHTNNDVGFAYDADNAEIMVIIDGVKVFSIGSGGIKPINLNYTPAVWAGGMVPVATTTGTSVVAANGTGWASEIIIPHRMVVTGVKVLTAATAGGTANAKGALWSASGTLLAVSAGVAMSGAAAMLTLAFTTAYTAAGPAKYFVGLVTDNNTDTFRSHAIGTHNAGSQSLTYASFTSMTPPTTFTADKGPYMSIY